jgi:hypothetical protein
MTVAPRLLYHRFLMRLSRIGRVLIVLAAVLVLGAGFCVTESHPGGHHASDGHGLVASFCSGMLATTVPTAPLLALALAGWALTLMSVSVPLALSFVLEPPPKLAFVR